MKHLVKRVFGAAALSLVAFGSAQAADIELMVFERSPYYVDQGDGTYGGVVAGPAAAAFEKAGVGFTWVKTPAKRQLKALEDNEKATCAPGWFKKPEREVFAKFTTVLYQDKPMGALVKKGGALSGQTSTADLLSNGGLKMGHKKGFAYGGHFDDAIASNSPKKVETTQGVDGLVNMLKGGRFDYMLISSEEAQPVLAANADLAWLDISDAPEGNKRYILCSKQVPDSVIEQLNAAIKG